MLKRIISAVVGLPILVMILVIGDTPLFVSSIIISLIGLREFFNTCKSKAILPVEIIGYLGSIILLTLMYFSYDPSYILLLFIILFFILSCIQLLSGKYNFIDISITVYGLIYIPLFFGHILLINNQPNSMAIWFVFITAWATDTFAYFSGYFFGKRKLCPTISPKKTVEGAIGGVVGSVIVSLIFGYFFFKDHLLAVGLMGVLGSIVAQLGDLSASLIKRYTGVKDFGNLIPGHGGVLDRFDSILFTAPMVYYILTFLIN